MRDGLNSHARRSWRRVGWSLLAIALLAVFVFSAWKGFTLLRDRVRGAIAKTVGTFPQDWARYRWQRPYKALAISYDDPKGPWVWGYSYEALTMRDAVSLARQSCEERRQKWPLSTPCRLYAVNEEVVFDYSEAALSKVFEKYGSMEGQGRE